MPNQARPEAVELPELPVSAGREASGDPLVPDGAAMMGDGQLGGVLLEQGPEYSNPEGSAELPFIEPGAPPPNLSRRVQTARSSPNRESSQSKARS